MEALLLSLDWGSALLQGGHALLGPWPLGTACRLPAPVTPVWVSGRDTASTDRATGCRKEVSIRGSLVRDSRWWCIPSSLPVPYLLHLGVPLWHQDTSQGHSLNCIQRTPPACGMEPLDFPDLPPWRLHTGAGLRWPCSGQSSQLGPSPDLFPPSCILLSCWHHWER